ncbi:MAG: hypothetical protein CFE38_06165 [Comamonadaceae bacterium PBBC1]|nr:MAG: hypothetical protein CFE38_06165 [Comamonadaceae bacterium PBBC1]
MALPWLIGGLAIAGVTALVKKLSEDDDDDDSYDYESASRRRAVHERAQIDRQKRLETENENFLIRGESIGVDLSKSLKNWIEVDFEKSPAFLIKLTSESENNESPNPSAQNVTDFLPRFSVKNDLFEEIRKNLKIYTESYSIKLKKCDKLVNAEKEFKVVESELQLIDLLKVEISRIKRELSV